MNNTFFLPVGKVVTVYSIDKQNYSGTLQGIINLGGIPSIWLKNENTDIILLMNNVCGITVLNEKTNSFKQLIQ